MALTVPTGAPFEDLLGAGDSATTPMSLEQYGSALKAASPQFEAPVLRTYIPTATAAYNATTNQFFVNGAVFDADNDTAFVDSLKYLDPKNRTALPEGDWIPVTTDSYLNHVKSIADPTTWQLAKKNIGIGVDNLQLLTGYGLQFLGAKETGQSIVKQQIQDLQKTQVYQREFTDVGEEGKDLGFGVKTADRGLFDWFIANLAQQGPNIVESAVTFGIGFAAGGAAGGGPNPVTAAGGALLALTGKESFKRGLMAAATKYSRGEALDAAEEKLLREAAGIYAAGVIKNPAAAKGMIRYDDIIANRAKDAAERAALQQQAQILRQGAESTFKRAGRAGGAGLLTAGQNFATGISDVYGETLEGGEGSRLTAIALGIPYGLLESASEFIFANRVFGNAVPDWAAKGRLSDIKTKGGKTIEVTKRLFTGGAVGGFSEGLTELGQEVLTVAANPLLDLNSPEGVKRLVNAFAAGFGVGGPIGGLTNLRDNKEPVNMLDSFVDPSPSREVVPQGQAQLMRGVAPQDKDFMAGAEGIRTARGTDRLYYGEVAPGQFNGPQGVLDLGGATISELQMRSRTPNVAPQVVWDQALQQWREVNPEDQMIDIARQMDLLGQPVNEGQLQLDLSPQAPAGVGFTEQPLVSNPILQIQMQRAQAQAAQAQAAAQAEAQRQADLQRLAVLAQNQRQLDIAAQAEAQAQQQQLAPAPMPMRPVTVRQPQQISMFDRGQAFANMPRPSRGEALRRGGAGGALPVATAPAVAPRVDLRRSPQVAMFTQQGEPTLAALKSAGTRGPVAKPTIEKGTRQIPPTGAVVTPTTKAAALKKATRGRKPMTEFEKEAAAVYDALKDPTDPTFEELGRDRQQVWYDAYKQAKEAENAVQERSTKKVDARQRTGDGEKVGEGDTGQRKTAKKGEALKKKKPKQPVQSKVEKVEPTERATDDEYIRVYNKYKALTGTQRDQVAKSLGATRQQMPDLLEERTLDVDKAIDEVLAPPTPPKGGAALKKAPAKKPEAKAKPAPKAAKLQKGPAGVFSAMVAQLTQAPVVAGETKKKDTTTTSEEEADREELDEAIREADSATDAATYQEALYTIVGYFALEGNKAKYTYKRAEEFLKGTTEKYDGIPLADFVQALREVAIDKGRIDKKSNLYKLLAEHNLLTDPAIAKRVSSGTAKTTQEKMVGGRTTSGNAEVKAENRLSDLINNRNGYLNKKQLRNEALSLWAQVDDESFSVGSRGVLSDFFDSNDEPIIVQIPGTSNFVLSNKAEDKMSTEEFTEKHNQARADLRAIEDEDRTTLDDVQSDPLYDNWAGTNKGGLEFYRVDGKPMKPIEIGKLRLIVGRIVSQYARKPNVYVYTNLQEMQRSNPKLFREAAEARKEGDIEAVNAAGMAWGDKVVLFSENIATERQARFIIAHETIGHVGLRGLFGKAFDRVLEQAAARDEQLSHAADVYATTYGVSRLEAIEEVLADRAAAVDTNTILRVWNWVKNQLNKFGFSFRDDAARYIIGLSRQYVREGRGRTEVNISSLYKEINSALASEMSPVEVLRFMQMAPQGSLTFAANAANRNSAIYGGMERSFRDIMEAQNKIAEARSQGKGLLKNAEFVWKKSLELLQTQDNMARKSKGYSLIHGILQRKAAKQQEFKTRYADGTETAHKAKLLGFGDGMTPEQNVRAGELLAYGSINRMGNLTDKMLAGTENLVSYDAEANIFTVNWPAYYNMLEQSTLTPEEFAKGFQIQQGTTTADMTQAERDRLAGLRDAEVLRTEKEIETAVARYDKKIAEATDEDAKLETELAKRKTVKNLKAEIDQIKKLYAQRIAAPKYEVPNMTNTPEWFKEVTGTLTTDNDGNLVYEGDSLEYKVYLEFVQTMASSHLDVLMAKYQGSYHEQTRAIEEGIRESFRKTERLAEAERKFINDAVALYDEMRMEGGAFKNNKFVMLDTSKQSAQDFLNKFARSFYQDMAIPELAEMMKGRYTAEQVNTLVRAMRSKLKKQINPDIDPASRSSIWGLKFKIEERQMFADTVGEDQMYAKKSIMGAYVPLTREGEFQVRIQAFATDAKGNKYPVKLRQGQQDSLAYYKTATLKDAEEVARETDAIFAGEFDLLDADGQVVKVTFESQIETAEQTPALVDILHYDEVMYSLSKLGLRLDAIQQEQLVKKVAAQNSRARANLQRAQVSGWDKNVVKGASAFLEQQAYTASNKMFRHQFDTVLENEENWSGSEVELNRLRTEWEQATGPRKVILGREYAQERYWAEMAKGDITVGGKKVNMANYYKERAKSLLDWMDSTGDIVHADDVWSNNEWALSARTMTAIAQLGGSIATGIAQVLSLPTNSWAYLASYNDKNGFGVGLGAARASGLLFTMAKAVGNFKYKNLDYINQQLAEAQASPRGVAKNGLTLDELDFLRIMTEEQRLDAAQYNALTGTVRGKKVTGNPVFQKFVQAWMFPFSYTEQFNRRVTLLAAYRGEFERQIAAGVDRSEAITKAREVAAKALDATQGDYSQYNRPSIFRGGVQSFIYMYKQYPIMMIQLLKNMDYRGRVIMLGSLILLSGLRGLPGADDLLDVADGLAQRLGMKTGSLEKEFMRIVNETFGKEMGGEINAVMMRGVLDRIFGWSFSNRLGLGDIVPGTGLLKPSISKQEVIRELENIAGAPTSFISGSLSYVFDTVPGVITGRKGAGALVGDLPVRAIQNVSDSWKYAETGAILDKKGYVVAKNAAAHEILGKALGFYPSRAQMQMDWMAADRQEQAYMQYVKAEFIKRGVAARLRNDREAYNDIKETVREWNESVKGTRLEIRTFSQSVTRAYLEAKKPLVKRALKSSATGGREEAKELLRMYGIDESVLEGN